MKSKRIVPFLIVIVGVFLTMLVAGLDVTTSFNKIPTDETPSCILITGDLDLSCLKNVQTERYPKEGLVDSDGIRGTRITGTNCIFGNLPSPVDFFSTGINLEDTAEVCPSLFQKVFSPRGELIDTLQP